MAGFFRLDFKLVQSIPEIEFSSRQIQLKTIVYHLCLKLFKSCDLDFQGSFLPKHQNSAKMRNYRWQVQTKAPSRQYPPDTGSLYWLSFKHRVLCTAELNNSVQTPQSSVRGCFASLSY